MQKDIWQNWQFEYETAMKEAAGQRKPVLLQFHREPCSGCKKMYAVTYPAEPVYEELRRWFVLLRLDILEDRQIRSQLSAVWTPSFYFLDHRGKVYFKQAGYLPPDDFRIIMRLALAEYLIPRGKYIEAKKLLRDGLERFPDNPRAAALLFRIGMADYLKSWDNKIFKAHMKQLRERYPHSAEARQWPWMDESEME